MRIVRYTWNGTGAACYLCIGAIPDKVTLWAAESSAHKKVTAWPRRGVCAEMDNGLLEVGGSGNFAPYTAGSGVEPYEGGDILTSATQTSVAYGEGVYLGVDIANYAANLNYGGTDEIVSWTLDTSGNRTGHFNADTLSAGVTRIGEGSPILIREATTQKVKVALIEALTAGQGMESDEVTLSRVVASGTVLRIGGMYDMKPLAVGSVTPAGIKVNITTNINANDEINILEAEFDD